MSKKRRLLSAACFTLAGALFAAGGKQPRTGETEIVFYYPIQAAGNAVQGMERIISDFNEKNRKGIKVTPVYTGSYRQTAQKAMTDIAAGNGPQVVLSGMLDIIDYYNVGAVRNIKALINGEGDDWKGDFIDGFRGNYNFDDGGVYGLPFQHSICVLFYNEDILKKAGVAAPPASWEEMVKAAVAVKAYNAGIIPVEFPSDVWILETLTLSSSEELVKNKRETNFASPAAVDSLDFLSRLIKSGGMIQSWAGAAEDFAAESCAMMFNTSGNIGFVSRSASCKWGVAIMPVKNSPVFSSGGGGLIMISGQSPDKEAASWEFMKYMTSPEISARWMETSGYFAVRKSAASLKQVKDYYAANPQAGQAAALLRYTRSQWSTDRYWEVYAFMQNALDTVLIRGNTRAADALARAQRDSAGLFK